MFQQYTVTGVMYGEIMSLSMGKKTESSLGPLSWITTDQTKRANIPIMSQTCCWSLTNCLKMICNDFLVVKVNCWSYVFNIMKYMWILRNVKNKNIVQKNVWKCAPMIRKWWRHTRKTQPNYEPNSVLSVECWQPIAQQHIGMTNVAIGS